MVELENTEEIQKEIPKDITANHNIGLVELENTEEIQKEIPKDTTVNHNNGLVIFLCMLSGWNGSIPLLKEHAEAMIREGARDGLMYGRPKETFIKYHGAAYGGLMSAVGLGTYYGVHDLLAKKRGVYDVYNWMGAACAGSATLLLTYPLPLRARMKLALTSTIAGAFFSVPMHFIHLKQLEMLKSSKPNMKDSPESL